MPTIHHLCSQWLISLMEVAQSLTWIYFSVSSSVMAVVRFYSNEAVKGRSLQQAAKLCPELSITTELCYNVELTGETPRDAQMQMTYALILWSLQGFRLYFLHSFLPSVFSSCLLLQAVRVWVLNRRRFSSGCFVHPCRQSHYQRSQTSQRLVGRNWWRLAPGMTALSKSDKWSLTHPMAQLLSHNGPYVLYHSEDKCVYISLACFENLKWVVCH